MTETRVRRGRAAARSSRTNPSRAALAQTDGLQIRSARRADLDPIITIDASVTGLEKRKYWLSVFRRYGQGERSGQQFLVALQQGQVVGFVIGEVRDWEFGSPPCGWVFAIDVAPQARLAGVGTALLQAISAGFRRAGVRKLRTLLARDNTLILSFFRSQGMMTGPFIPLEMDLDA